jgi:insertion element IS1 protein InsB
MAPNLCQRKIRSGATASPGSTQKKGSLTIQCDELWSFVDHKGNKQWVWLALDADTREIVGVYIGARDEAAARKLWASVSPVYRQCAIAYTDFWAAYGAVLPSKRHRAVGKETGKTSYIERFNNTLRQRVSRLVRKTLSFSKSVENHIGAIWYFIHHYNASLLVWHYPALDAFWRRNHVGSRPQRNCPSIAFYL